MYFLVPQVVVYGPPASGQNAVVSVNKANNIIVVYTYLYYLCFE